MYSTSTNYTTDVTLQSCITRVVPGWPGLYLHKPHTRQNNHTITSSEYTVPMHWHIFWHCHCRAMTPTAKKELRWLRSKFRIPCFSLPLQTGPLWFWSGAVYPCLVRSNYSLQKWVSGNESSVVTIWHERYFVILVQTYFVRGEEEWPCQPWTTLSKLHRWGQIKFTVPL